MAFTLTLKPGSSSPACASASAACAGERPLEHGALELAARAGLLCQLNHERRVEPAVHGMLHAQERLRAHGAAGIELRLVAQLEGPRADGGPHVLGERAGHRAQRARGRHELHRAPGALVVLERCEQRFVLHPRVIVGQPLVAAQERQVQHRAERDAHELQHGSGGLSP